MSEWGIRDEHVVQSRANSHVLTTGTEQYARVLDGYACDTAASLRHGWIVPVKTTLTALVVNLQTVTTNPAARFRLYTGEYAGSFTEVWDSNDLDPAKALPNAGTPYRFEIPDVEIDAGTNMVLTVEDDGAIAISMFSWAVLGR